MHFDTLTVRERGNGNDVVLRDNCPVESVFKGDDFCWGADGWLVRC